MTEFEVFFNLFNSNMGGLDFNYWLNKTDI